jgi:hypothetical protein
MPLRVKSRESLCGREDQIFSRGNQRPGFCGNCLLGQIWNQGSKSGFSLSKEIGENLTGIEILQPRRELADARPYAGSENTAPNQLVEAVPVLVAILHNRVQAIRVWPC